MLKDPGEPGTKILTTLRGSGIDASPDANLRFAREAVGAAFKQLHYHAQHFATRTGTDYIRPVLDANRGSARDALVGDDAAGGRPGDGSNRDAWINSNLDRRLQYLRKHQPHVYLVGRNWDTRRENHAPLYDEKGNLVGTGLYWDSESFGNKRFFKIRLLASGTEQGVKDYSQIYQLALNTPEGLPWLPRDPEFLQVFDKLPNADTVWGAVRAAAAADLPHSTRDAAVERERARVGEAAPVSEMESASRAAKLELFPAWRKLLLMKVDDGIQKAPAKRKMRVQYAHNESYSNDLNFDLYPVRINRFSTSSGTVMTPEEFLKYVRLNLNSLLDTSFYPYSLLEAALWADERCYNRIS